jgi:hypothetical protein
MALWFCELRAKEIIGNASINQSHLNNRWATRKQIESRYVVNVNDYEFANYAVYEG